MNKKVQVSKDKLEEMRTFLDELPENQEAKLSAAQAIMELRKSIEKARKKGWTKEQISTKLKSQFNIDIKPSYITVAMREKKPRAAAASKDAPSETVIPEPLDKTPTGTQEPPATKKG